MTAEEASSPAIPLPMRDRYDAFIARHEIAWELDMGALAFARA